MDLLLHILLPLGVLVIFSILALKFRKRESVRKGRGRDLSASPSMEKPLDEATAGESETTEEDRSRPLDEVIAEGRARYEELLKKPQPASAHGPQPSYTVTQIFYATDRKPSDQDSCTTYGNEHSLGGNVSLGTCGVSIPRDHRLGELEHPSIWRLEFREDPEKHVVLLGITPEYESVFWEKLGDRVSASTSSAA